MTVNIGDSITAVSYNTLADKIDDWFSDGCPFCAFGNPNQKFGWGGVINPDKNIGNTILATDFNKMIDRINIGVDIVNGVGGLIFSVSPGADITASTYNVIDAREVSIRALKNTIDPSELSIHAGTTDARTTVWTGTIDDICRYTFASFPKARYLFNSGGAILISMALVGGSTGNAANWITLFSRMGTVVLDLDNTYQTGYGGAPSGIGYYTLTTSWQLIFTQSGPGYVYTDNEIEINARRSASGNYVEIQVVLNDDHAGSVDGTTTATFQYKKLDDQSYVEASLTITAPSVAIQETFE